MTSTRRTGLAVAVSIGAGLTLAASSPALAQLPAPSGSVVPGEVIVRFESSASTATQSRALDRAGTSGSRAVRGLARTRLLEVPAGTPPTAAARELEESPGVEWAEPNMTFQIARDASDPGFSSLWGLRNVGQTVGGVGGTPGADIDAQAAWDTTVGDARVLVGVVDSGIDPSHPDLAGNHRADLSRSFAGGPDGVVDPADWDDANQHGSHVAGTIGALGSNGVGVAGVSWDAGLFGARACDFRGACTTAALAEALSYAGSVGARVVNVSITSPPSEAVQAAIAAHPRTLYVAAAGNDARDNDVTPAHPCTIGLENVICVAATDQSDGLASFSNFGATAVDLGAPGVNILSTVPRLVTTALGTATSGWTQEPRGRWDEARFSRSKALSFVDWPSPLPFESVLTYGAPLDLSGLDACRVSYELDLETTHPGQRLQVEASSDGATWVPIQSQRDGYNGSTGGRIVPVHDDLGAFDGTRGVRIRYRLGVQPRAGHRRALVRVFSPRVVCRGPQPAGGAYRLMDGTSMATPHVTGVAALLFAKQPGLDVAGARAALLGSVDPRPALAGRTVAGGRLNARAALAAVSAPPGPREPAPTSVAPVSAGQAPPDLAPRPATDACAPTPPRRDSTNDSLTLSRRQLLINQRIYQAAVRRANAIERWLEAGIEERDICGGTIAADDLGEGLAPTGRASATVRSANPRRLEVAPARKGSGASVDMSERQLLLNQRVGQAAIRRSNALHARLERGLTGGDIQAGALAPGHLVPGLGVARLASAERPAASRTEMRSAGSKASGSVEMSVAQMRTNQLIGQAAIRRTNELLDRVAAGIRGSDIRPGSLVAANFSGSGDE